MRRFSITNQQLEDELLVYLKKEKKESVRYNTLIITDL